MVCEGELKVVEMEIKANEDDANRGVECMAARDVDIIVRGDGVVEIRIGATYVRNGFRVKLGFYPGFAEDEDGALGGGKRQDTRNVDCGAVRGAKNFVL